MGNDILLGFFFADFETSVPSAKLLGGFAKVRVLFTRWGI